MDKKTFTETVERLKEVNGVVSDLDPAIREAAFKALVPYVAGQEPPTGTPDQTKEKQHEKPTPGALDLDQLLEDNESDKPAENAILAAAIFYGRYGKKPFQASDIRQIAADTGLVIPERPDRTFDGMKRDGKELFRKVGSEFRYTPHGEGWFRATYGISPGKEERPES